MLWDIVAPPRAGLSRGPFDDQPTGLPRTLPCHFAYAPAHSARRSGQRVGDRPEGHSRQLLVRATVQTAFVRAADTARRRRCWRSRSASDAAGHPLGRRLNEVEVPCALFHDGRSSRVEVWTARTACGIGIESAEFVTRNGFALSSTAIDARTRTDEPTVTVGPNCELRVRRARR
jgi:hypothetical protein